MGRLPILSLVTVICSILASPAHAQNVSCSIGEIFGGATIRLGSVLEEIELSNFREEGQVGITATIEGNGNTAQFAYSANYNLVGNRIEFTSNAAIGSQFKINVPIEEVQSHFGFFPTVSCYMR
jgi:hypothetical protein